MKIDTHTPAITSELGITTNSLDHTFKQLSNSFARLLGKYAFADERPEIFKGNNFTHDGIAYAPMRMKSTRALKRRFINFWRTYRGEPHTAIMMLDIDQKVSPDVWAMAGLPKPLLTNTNPVSGHCQIVYMMDKLLDKNEYYLIRDSMLNALNNVGVQVDYSKPENMRSPFFDPFYTRIDKDIKERYQVKRKQASISYEKRGKVQADYTVVTLYEWNEYDPEDLYMKPLDLNNVDFSEAQEIPVSFNTVQLTSVKATPKACGSTSLFDQLRELCYPMYSKTRNWEHNGYEVVCSIGREIGANEKLCKQVFEWMGVEFPKSHDPSKSRGKGRSWALARWSKERMRGQLKTDFADKEGFSRQYAHKLEKEGKIYKWFGHWFYTKNKVSNPVEYMKSFHKEVVTEENLVIFNKHVNQSFDDGDGFDNLTVQEYIIEPPIPPPIDYKSLSTRQLLELFET